MKNVFIINAHQPYPFSEGKLNHELVKKAKAQLEAAGMNVKTTASAQGYDVEEELEKHQWADIVILQSPVNWMGVPWSFKKYMDEVYSTGMQGQLTQFDGRSEENPKENYGTGGTLKGKRYMLSLTFNAPEESFNNENEFLFQGKSVDDLFFPMHMNFRFFAMNALPTFSCFDVMKNPEVESDIERFKAHLQKHVIK